MAREVRLWEWLRDGLRAVPLLHMRRVENMVSTGDPDVDGCWNGDYFELELKGCDRPVRADSLLTFDIRQSQVLFHRKRWRAGGRIWIYIRVGKDRATMRYLIPSSHMQELSLGVTEERLRQMTALPLVHDQMDLLRMAVTKRDPAVVPPSDDHNRAGIEAFQDGRRGL